MRSTETCPAPHPIRGEDGLVFHPDLEVMGGCSTDAWLRCRRCGRWFWTVTDTGKFDYQDNWDLETEEAKAALLRREPAAVVAMLVRHGIPHGPVWGDERALLDLLKELLPDLSDADLATALEGAPGLWVRVHARLQARKRKAKAPPPLPFRLDAPLDFAGEYVLEKGEGVVVVGGTTILWVRGDGATIRYTFPAPPRFLDRGIWAVPTPEGESVVVLGDDGRISAWPPSPRSYTVVDLEKDGWWFLADGEAEFRAPDTRPLWKIALATEPFVSIPAPPRRMPGGWIVGGCRTDEGQSQALTLFDAERRMVASSTGLSGGRSVEVLSDTALWAETLAFPFLLERWVREDADLRRTFDVAVCHTVSVAGMRIALQRAGGLAAYDAEGRRVWSRPEQTTPGVYLSTVSDRVVVQGPEDVQVLDARDGREVDRFDLFHGADLLQDRRGTLYFVSGNEARILGDGRSRPVVLPWEAETVTTCGDAVVLRDTDGEHYLVLAGDGEIRGGFEARDARFSVIGTERGPYVLEPGRLRVG